MIENFKTCLHAKSECVRDVCDKKRIQSLIVSNSICNGNHLVIPIAKLDPAFIERWLRSSSKDDFIHFLFFVTVYMIYGNSLHNIVEQNTSI